MEADKDQLITEDADVAYRKCPGVNNVAYVVSKELENVETFTSEMFHLSGQRHFAFIRQSKTGNELFSDDFLNLTHFKHIQSLSFHCNYFYQY